MSTTFDVHELEHLRWLAVHGGGDDLADANCWRDAKPAIAPLLEVLDAAVGVWNLPKRFVWSHGEADEITCYCGWQSKSDDYEKAHKALRAHMVREEKKVLMDASKRHKRLEDAMAAFAGVQVWGPDHPSYDEMGQ